MKQYLDLVRDVLANGEVKTDRTGTGTRSMFGYQMRFDLRDGFPLVTTKKIILDSVIRELLWFIKGATNIHDGLMPHSKIWNAWADDDGNLGPIYGYQWRHWNQFVPIPGTSDSYEKRHIDQLANAIHMIKTTPDSRRIIVSAWNPSDLDQMALPPCHSFFQFAVSNGCLDLQLYQRSADIAVGVPFNIASYALLLTMVAQDCHLTPRYFVHTLGDAHIYTNHVEGLRVQLDRSPKPLPKLHVPPKSVFDVHFDDIRIDGYDPHPFIKFPVAV
ncbi:thymidylate synthase [bacterium]|nr:thymidylate synthase [bacterium]